MSYVCSFLFGNEVGLGFSGICDFWLCFLELVIVWLLGGKGSDLVVVLFDVVFIFIIGIVKGMCVC